MLPEVRIEIAPWGMATDKGELLGLVMPVFPVGCSLSGCVRLVKIHPAVYLGFLKFSAGVRLR